MTRWPCAVAGAGRRTGCWILMSGPFSTPFRIPFAEGGRSPHQRRWVLLYVRRWLTAPLQLPGGTMEQREGTPQGSAVSPSWLTCSCTTRSTRGWNGSSRLPVRALRRRHGGALRYRGAGTAGAGRARRADRVSRAGAASREDEDRVLQGRAGGAAWLGTRRFDVPRLHLRPPGPYPDGRRLSRLPARRQRRRQQGDRSAGPGLADPTPQQGTTLVSSRTDQPQVAGWMTISAPRGAAVADGGERPSISLLS